MAPVGERAAAVAVRKQPLEIVEALLGEAIICLGARQRMLEIGRLHVHRADHDPADRGDEPGERRGRRGRSIDDRGQTPAGRVGVLEARVAVVHRHAELYAALSAANDARRVGQERDRAVLADHGRARSAHVARSEQIEIETACVPRRGKATNGEPG